MRQRERAYKIWEDEGRTDGAHHDHWARAEEQDEKTAAKVTDANRKASKTFNGEEPKNMSGSDSRPPSIVSPD